MFIIIKKQIIFAVKMLIPLMARVFNVKILKKDQTLEFLRFAAIEFYPRTPVELIPIEIFGGTIESYEKKDVVKSSYSAVYCFSGVELKILSYGGIQVGTKVLNLDFGSSEFIRTCFKTPERKKKHSKNCIVLWSHYWGGYYDYLFFIYSKLLRIKEVIGEEEFEQSIILYPLLGKPFERELLKIAGLDDNQVLDVRDYTVEAVNYYFANNDSWFYPCIKDINNLRKMSLSISIKKSFKRIYISRKHRRILSNEIEIIKVLREFDFQIIKDEERTVKEQMEIYSSADLILGPHGASFSNILWCKKNTILIEIFSNRYYPPYFKYLAKVLGVKYYAIIENDVGPNDEAYSYNNIYISPEVMRSSLRRIISKQAVSTPSASSFDKELKFR